MPDFIPGLVLNETYYWQAVRPILDARFPGLPHTAALVDYGSDVLGFDTPVSVDHEWGPRLNLFLPPEDFEARRAAVHETLRQELPVQVLGYSTHFGRPVSDDNGVRHRTEIEHGPVDHHIAIDTLANFWQGQLKIEPSAEPTPADWLTFPQQTLLTVTSGKVYHDDLGLEDLRRRYAYYPHDVWLYLLANQWRIISEIEAFAGRTWTTGDILGSRIIFARLADRLIHLCFLMERRYAPYAKWLGTGFQRLACYPRMGPLLEQALTAPDYPACERALAQAYSLAAELHNALQITPPLDPRTRTYAGWHVLRSDPNLPFDYAGTRPFQCIYGKRFADAITAAIRDPQVLALRSGLGGVDQFLEESAGGLLDTDFCRELKEVLSEK
jgi:hypothetical protein